MSMDIGSKGVRSDINVTPLVDVVLVLLIIFMVVTPMMQKGRAVELPRAKNVLTGKSPHEQMYVIVTKDLRYFVDNNQVQFDEITGKIQKKPPFNPGLEVVVKGDKNLEYGSVRKVMSTCRKAGAKRVVLATKEIKEG